MPTISDIRRTLDKAGIDHRGCMSMKELEDLYYNDASGYICPRRPGRPTMSVSVGSRSVRERGILGPEGLSSQGMASCKTMRCAQKRIVPGPNTSRSSPSQRSTASLNELCAKV